jgi:hypothetical protein
MELVNGSDAFSAYCERLQTTESPEDLLIAVEDNTHCSCTELGDDELELELGLVTSRTTVWA